MREILYTVAMYLALVGMIRILGKRQIGEMGPTEFVVTMMAANLATAAIEQPGASFLGSFGAILAILAAEMALSRLVLESIPLRHLICGKPVLLIENGRLLRENLRRTRVSLDDLTGQLRQKDVLDLTAVQYAILETDGGLSVFLYGKDRPATAGEAGIRPEETRLPMTLVEDGRLLKENLRKAGKDRAWLSRVLRDRGIEQKQVLLLTLDDGGHILTVLKD